MGMLARLGVVLGLDSGEFKQGLESADKSLTKFAAKLPQMGVVAAAAFTAATYKALQYADAVSDAAKASDVAVSSVIALSKGLQQNGGNADDAGKLLATFSAQVDEAAQGSLAAQKAFARVGVTLKDLGELGTEDLFDKTVKAIAAIEDPAARAALATTMFGKAAKGVDFVGLAEGADEAKEKFKEYAAAVEMAAELNDKLEAAGTAMSLSFTNAVIPTLLKVYDALAEDSRGMEVLMDVTKFAVKFIADSFHTAYTVVMSLVEATIFLKNAIVALFTDATVAEEYEKYNKRIGELIKKNIEFRDSIWSDEKPEPKAKPKFAGRQVTEAKNPEDEKRKRMLEAIEMAKKLSVEYERQSQFDLDQIRRKAELNGMTEKERQVAEAMMQMREQREQKLEAIESKRQDAIIKGELELAKELQNQKDIIAERSDFFIAATEAEIKAIQAEQNTFAFGWNQAFAQYMEDSENAAKRGQEVFQTVTGNMNAAIENFVRTGKLSFSSLASSIIRDLIAIQMKAQASSMLMMMFGGGKYTPGSSSFVGPMQPKADGGYVNSNTPYMVGERGPEMFIPQGSGTIIPNNRMQSGGGGNKTVNNFTINAIDTKSFEQRLFTSSNAIWAANQYANKSLAAVGGRS